MVPRRRRETPDHYIAAGRQKDGTFYINNPDPAKDRMYSDMNTGSLPPGLRYSP